MRDRHLVLKLWRKNYMAGGSPYLMNEWETLANCSTYVTLSQEPMIVH